MYKKKKEGISLVVLTVTIIVLIILAGATILTISNAELIGQTNQTAFKTNVSNYLEEYNIWLSTQKMLYRGNLDVSQINVSSQKAYNGSYIKDIIKNIKEEDVDKYEIIGGNLVYTGAGDETKWANELGLKSIEKAKGEEDTIVFSDTKKDSAYNDFKIYGSSENGVSGLSEITLTVTQNLIDNGFGEYKDTTNFSSTMVNLPNEKIKGGVSSFSASYKGGVLSDKQLSYMVVDVNKKYELSAYVKPNSTDLKIYSGLIEYDIDNKIIYMENVLYVDGTTTYLTKDLKKGDTVVYLNDVSKFEATSTTSNYKLGFIVWDYKDSAGNLYGPETYSKKVYSSLYTYDNVDKTNNTITLKTPWNRNTISAGTKLSQSNAGNTYNYGLYFTPNLADTEWKYRHIAIQGVFEKDVRNDKFRNPTKYVSWFIMPNYSSVEGGGVKIANLIFAESDKYNKEFTVDMAGHDPIRTMDDGTSDYIDFKNKRIVRNVGVNNGTMYKLSNVVYENISLPTLPIYEKNTAITLKQTGRLEGTYAK